MVFWEEDLVSLPDLSIDNLTNILFINPRENEQSGLSSYLIESGDDQSITSGNNTDQYNRSSLWGEILHVRRQVSKRYIRQRASMRNRRNQNQGNYLIILFITH